MAPTPAVKVGSESQADSICQEKDNVLQKDQHQLRSITMQDTQTGQAKGAQSLAPVNDPESRNSNFSVKDAGVDHESNDVDTVIDHTTLADNTKQMADYTGADSRSDGTTELFSSNSDFDKTTSETMNLPECKTDLLKTESQGKSSKKANDTDRECEVVDNEFYDEINERQDKSPDVTVEEDDNGVPIDRGWAWMVDLSCFLMFLVYSTPPQFHSILLLDYLDKFDCTVSVITGMLSASGVTYCIATQTSTTFLVNRFTNRNVAVLAGIVNVVASLAFVASVNIPTFVITNIVKSMAKGCCLVPTVTLVGFYFRRRRAIATALGFLGYSVCCVLTPPLIRYLREEYGFRGCFLLLAGFEMHAIVAALLLRPLSSYKPKKSGSKINMLPREEQAPLLPVESNVPPVTSQSTSLELVKLRVPAPNIVKYSTTEVTGCKTEAEQTTLKNTCSLNTDEMCGIDVADEKDNQIAEDLTSEVENSTTRQDIQKGFHTKSADNQGRQCDAGNSQSDHRNGHSSCVTGTKNQTENLRNVSLDKSKPTFQNEAAGAYRPVRLTISRAIEKASSWSLDTASFMGSAINMTSILEPKSEVLSEHEAEPGIRCSYCSWMGKIVDVSLLKNFLCLMLSVCYALDNSGFYSCLFLPSYAIKMGVSPPKAAILLTIVGAVDMGGRVSVGLFTDLKLVRPNVIIAVSCLILGGVNFLAQLYQGFGELVFFSVMLGLLTSVGQSLNTSLITDVMGTVHLAKLWAMGSLFLGMTTIVQHPIHGALIEATGNFVATFHYAGACLILAAVLLLSEPFLRKLQLAREKKNALKSQVNV